MPFAASLVAAPLVAAPILPDAFRHVLEEGAANGAYDTVAVGLIEGKEQKTWFFGGAAGKLGTSGESQFEIGATSEVFTALLLAQAVFDGKLRLQDPIRKLLPPDFALAEPKLGEISLEELATHRSGLPATPANLLPTDSYDPYAGYSTTAMLTFFANYHPATVDHNYAYSLLNPGLLAYLLAHAYGADYPGLLTRKILTPLGLAHSSFADASDLLSGHAYGQPAEHWHFDALAGAAGLRASVTDLLMFLHHNLSPNDSPLRNALLLARQPRAQADAGELGLGWNVREVAMGNQTWPLVWRASETGGFSTFIGFRTDQQKALVLLANSSVPLAALGVAWLSGDAPPHASQKPYTPTPTHLAQYPGLYQLLSGSEVTVRVTNGELSTQLHGEPAWPMYPYAEDAYKTSGGTADISFTRDVDQVAGLVLHLNGDYIVAKRLSEAAPILQRPPMPITAKALLEFGGDYQLGADSLLRISPQPDSLTMQLTGTDRVAMRAYAKDRFAAADGVDTIMFRRDADGKITGLVLDLAGGEHEGTLIRWKAP